MLTSPDITRLQEKAEDCKRALAACVKAMAGDKNAEVIFTSGQTRIVGNRIYIVDPPVDNPKALKIWRAEADSVALRLKHYKIKDDLAFRPEDGGGAEIFTRLMQLRCELLGARTYPGVKANMRARYAKLFEEKANAILASDRLSTEFIAYRFLSDLAPDFPEKTIAAAITRHAELLPEGAEAHLETLRETAANSEAFARAALQFIRFLQNPDPAHLGDNASAERDAGADEDPGDDTPPDPGAEDPPQSGGEAVKGDSLFDDHNQGESYGTVLSQDEPDGGAGESAFEGTGALREFAAGDFFSFEDEAGEGIGGKYKVFTPAFDREEKAENLCKSEELKTYRMQLDKAGAEYVSSVSRIASKLHRRLSGVTRHAWEYETETGEIDSGKLSTLITHPLETRIFKQEKEVSARDAVATLLIDNSGSMRGRPVTVAAVSADLIAAILERCGVKTEILGFTTAAWKGGRARELWKSRGEPPFPGRLNELLHIIYKSADVPRKKARDHIAAILKESVLKENIDGEALLWALSRLNRRPETRKILMVISDGAPVDDSTMSANSNAYLERHLRQVIDYIEKKTPVDLVAVGIGHDVTGWYKNAVTVRDTESLGAVMTKSFVDLFSA